MIDISVLIVCWNSADFIQECLDSIYRHTKGCSYEVIVVDNGSTDNTVNLLQRTFPNVKIVEAGANIGFPRACNIALRFAKGDYIYLLNPDTRIESDVLTELLKFLQSHPEAGCAGPKLMEPDGSVALFAAREFPTITETIFRQLGLRKLFPRSQVFGKETLAGWDRQPFRRVPCVTGAAIMIPRSVFDLLGALDEQLPLYFEDLDICARITLSGKHVYYVPTATVLHLGGRSADLSPVRPLLFEMENGQAPWLYFLKFEGYWHARAFTLIIMFGSLFRLVLFSGASLVTVFNGARSTIWVRRQVTKSWALLRWSLTKNKSFVQKSWGYFSKGFVPIDPVGQGKHAEPIRTTRATNK